jgi:hypothetical protein
LLGNPVIVQLKSLHPKEGFEESERPASIPPSFARVHPRKALGLPEKVALLLKP